MSHAQQIENKYNHESIPNYQSSKCIIQIFMNEENKEPLLDTNTPTKQMSIRSRQSRVMSQLSNVSAGDAYIYDLPDLANVTQAVMCRLTAVSVVCVIFLAAEIVGGLLAQSLAILSDAAHMFSDMSGFFISIFSIWLGQRPASEKMSFGYHRAEVIGALASIILIWGLTILLFYEATMRMINKAVVTDPLIMLITAGFGLFCNLVMAKVLHSSPTGGHDHGNIMHQCGHDHGHGHGHGHSHGHGHGHDHGPKKKKSKSPKKKVFIQQKRSIISENGVSMLVVEQKLETSSSDSNARDKKFQPIKEDANENRSQSSSHDHMDNHNHSHMCDHKKQVSNLDHNHSENCDHDHQQLDIPIDPNETVEQKKRGSSERESCPSHDHDHKQNKHHSHDHEHEHDHDHHHEHNHEGCDGHDHDQNHDHTHDHDHDHDHEHQHEGCNGHDHHEHSHDELAAKRKKMMKSSNLSQIQENDNYNLKAAMIHVIGDILQSIGVLIAALLIYFFGEKKNEKGEIVFSYWQYADPGCTYLFSLLVLFTTFGVAKECLRVLMEGTPTGLIMEEFMQQLRAIHRVREVHDLHIWSLSVGKPAMSAHIVCIENPEYVLKKATKLCRQFGIYHSTIQIELLDRQGAKDYIKCEHNLHK